jgi:hypothetical protein
MFKVYRSYFAYQARRVQKAFDHNLKTKALAWLSTVALVSTMAAPFATQAAQLKPRKLTLSSSKAFVTGDPNVVHTFDFSLITAATLGSIKFEYCTTASGTCTLPTGLVTTSATLDTQTVETGFSMVNTTNGAPYITRTPAAITGPLPSAVQYALGGIRNPSTTNTTFFVRITTYASADTTGSSTDNGTVAASTANQIQLTGIMPESLVFCVAEDFTSSFDCTTSAGDNTVDFGFFDPSSTRTGTSEMIASTNAENGYSITVNGATLTSGSNTIPALASPTASSIGSSQFGLNLVANATPAVGVNRLQENAGAIGEATADYGGADPGYAGTNLYKFVTGDSVASSVEETNKTNFTTSYIVNVEGRQAAGTYTATMTYICTATF